MKKNVLDYAFPLLAALLLLAGCGNQTAEPGGEVILLAHYDRANSYVTPVVAAVAAIEGHGAETDAAGVQRVVLDVSGTALSLVDYQSHEQIIARLTDGDALTVAAVLVVMGSHGVMQDQHEQLRQAQAAGVPVVTVLQSQIHLIDDQELLDLVEVETEDALTQAGYPAGVPVQRVSAVKALEGDQSARDDMAQFITILRRQLQAHI